MWILDIETDGLLDTVTKVWVLVAKCVETGEMVTATGGQIPEFLKRIRSDTIVAHNGIGFDFIVLDRLYGFKPFAVYDTYILSQLFFPNEMGLHGLAAWGKVLNFPKGDHSDWSQLTDEMIEYCQRDVLLTQKIWEICSRELQSSDVDWSSAVKLEQDHYKVFTENCTGWFIDMDLLEYNIKLLERYIRFCELRLQHLTPMQVTAGSEVTLRKKDGSISSRAAAHAAKSGVSIFSFAGDFCKVSFSVTNLNSSKQVTAWLLSLGWVPDEYNYVKDNNGKDTDEVSSPKLSGSSYSGVPEHIAYPLRQHSKASARLGNLRGFLNSSYDIQTYSDGRTLGRIPTFAYTCGANTSRYRHSLVVNIPKAGSGVFFGDQMRSLFTVPPGYVLVGCDAAAIEARIEGHFTARYDGGEYARELLEADIHTKNANSWGISRQDAKAPYYALSYQAGPEKISAMLGCGIEKARMIWSRYWDDRPALRDLVSDLESALVQRNFAYRRGNRIIISHKRAWIRGVDGRKLFVRSPHSLKNTLIQSCGAVLLKSAAIYADKEFKRQKLDARIVINYHDEIDVIVKSGQEDKVKSVLESAWQNAGRQYNLRIPIVGEAKSGRNWKECH